MAGVRCWGPGIGRGFWEPAHCLFRGSLEEAVLLLRPLQRHTEMRWPLLDRLGCGFLSSRLKAPNYKSGME